MSQHEDIRQFVDILTLVISKSIRYNHSTLQTLGDFLDLADVLRYEEEDGTFDRRSWAIKTIAEHSEDMLAEVEGNQYGIGRDDIKRFAYDWSNLNAVNEGINDALKEMHIERTQASLIRGDIATWLSESKG